MDEFHKKILDLELQMSQVGQYPTRLMSSLKFNKLFDEESHKSTVAARKTEILQIKEVLEGYLSWDRNLEHALAEARQVADGNAEYFTDLMEQYEINEDEVNELLGPLEDEDDPLFINYQATNVDVTPDDEQEEDAYELRKYNLQEFSRFNDMHKAHDQDRDSPL